MAGTTDAQRLRAKGAPITLADGSEVRVRFGMAGILALEEYFGSITAVEEQMIALDANREVFTFMTKVIAAGLTHSGHSLASLLAEDLLDPDRVWEYAEAAGLAFREAFPAAGSLPEAPAAPTPPSRSQTGTTSSRSRSAAPKKPSGR